MESNSELPESEDYSPKVTIADIPSPPDGSTFYLQKIEKVTMPHPYTITPKHVEIAADHYSGILGEAAIEGAEKQGAKCGASRCNLPYGEHVTSLTLFIAVKSNRDLNSIPGLHAYLLSIKDKATELGIEGFAFPIG